MDKREIFRSVKLLLSTFFVAIFSPEKYQISDLISEDLIDSEIIDPQGWDYYWNESKQGGGLLYDAVASAYRRLIVKPALDRFFIKHFPEGAEVLHAGCGSGQVDTDILNRASIIALDISAKALRFYKKTNGDKCRLLHGSIFDIPLPDNSVDGVYNLGVMEHFTEDEIQSILTEFRRVLRPGGKILIFWPPEYGFSVLFFKLLGWFARTALGKKDVKFHPDEITRIKSRAHVEKIFERAGLEVVNYYFGPRDLFTQAVIAAVELPTNGQAGLSVSSIESSLQLKPLVVEDTSVQDQKIKSLLKVTANSR